MVDTVDVDALTTRLYTSAPEDFVKVRGEGVKQLKAAGQTEAAAAFSKLAKPSASAWAVDLLVAQRPGAIDDVVSRGDELRRAHTGGAGAKEIRTAQQARQDAIRTATDAAVELTGRDLSESHRGEIAATLEAASADAAAADEVRAGRLARPLPAPSGFDLLGGLTVIAGGRAASARATGRTASRSTESTTPAESDGDSQRARVEMLRADAAAATADAETAEAAAAELRDRVDSLQDERDRIDEELRRLERELTAARRELRDAERAATEAERKASRAVIRAERAEE